MADVVAIDVESKEHCGGLQVDRDGELSAHRGCGIPGDTTRKRRMQKAATYIGLKFQDRLTAALETGRRHLLSVRNAEGAWTGELSASALSTATAVVALEMVRRAEPVGNPDITSAIYQGHAWLTAHANDDGGWGDTVLSLSNISTTTLVWAALKCQAPGPGNSTGGSAVEVTEAIHRAENWLRTDAGGLQPDRLAAKILQRYGSDRTFSAPILTHCALAGCMGKGPGAWRHVVSLPFELAACPSEWFGALRLPVVSYALPALIAIGYARHYHAPSRNPLVRFLRQAVTERVFRVLESIQPPNGGFLEATPLTSFVLMSLAGSGRVGHPVARRCLDFILKSVQPDGSWKIDTNLSTFVTTLSTQAMGIAGPGFLSPTERRTIQDWLLRQQYGVRHLYTNAAPGGWAWTPLPGGVPDADDTAGALVALKMLELGSPAVCDAARSGVGWLLGLQNRDGGIPTFCRGWGKLPFDRSSPDITAHALRAWASWERDLPVEVQRQVRDASSRAIRFLKSVQEPEGSWTPLWFGNQCETDEANRTYGTSRVALALAEMKAAPENLRAAVQWLLSVQREDGGWNGGSGSACSSTEETGLALEALCASAQINPELRNQVSSAIQRGLEYLLRRVEDGSWTDPAPIGFYFAKLWYFEKLYPVVFAIAALERAKVYLSSQA